MSREPRDIALAYIDAIGGNRLHAAEELLHPDVEFTGPTRTLHGRAAYLEALRRLTPIIARSEVRRTFVEGNEVCVIYDLVTDTPVGAVPAVEWVQIEDGRIRRITLIFHSQPWPEVMQEASRRAKAAEPASLRA